jgi:hypothetical protein
LRESLLLTAAVILFCIITFTTSAQDGKFGLGVVLGEPTGVSAKLWLGQTSAVDGVVAWSFVNNPSVTIHADYLFHFFDVFPIEKGRLPLYVGIGGTISISPDPDVGVRIPFGAAYLFDTAPLDIFLEAAPIFLFLPATTFDFGGGLGIRFYFSSKKRASE